MVPQEKIEDFSVFATPKREPRAMGKPKQEMTPVIKKLAFVDEEELGEDDGHHGDEHGDEQMSEDSYDSMITREEPTSLLEESGTAMTTPARRMTRSAVVKAQSTPGDVGSDGAVEIWSYTPVKKLMF